MHARRFVLAVAFVCLAACNGESPQDPDGGGQPPDAPPFMLCGNGVMEGTEECDDNNDDADDGCSPTCAFECGDGAVTGTELCDSGIATGPGSCPTDETCVDEDPCTTGVVSGTGCEVVCEFATTTAPIDGDSCCPDGADGTTDNDCEAICGNGVLEAGEACDTSIEVGLAGACPTACNDGEDCTADALVDGGTCDAHCVAPEITTPGPDDGCCPGGATPGTDPDCSTTCGDGIVSGDETCDTGIATGPGSCPTACNDGDACTVDNLVNAGTCRAACNTSPTAPGPADTCCPAGSDLGDDPDCPPSCGDGVITPPETCDDDNDTAGDGCSAICRIEPVAFRFTDLDIRDPHLFATVIFCLDVTDSPLGQDGVNVLLQTNIQNDDPEDEDTILDLSIVNTFTPLVQTAGSTTAGDLTFPDCTAPMSSTSCTLPADATHTTATVTSTGTASPGPVCLGTVSGTTSNYTPAIGIPTATGSGTCYSANAGTVTFMLGDLPITLVDARIAGVWFGNPATEIKNGMIRGFMTEATANATIIPEGLTGFESIDGHPLSSLLRGGVGSCNSPSPATGDMDTLEGTTTKGWYFYLNFSAVRVPYTEQ
jgi:cysteine-rich repeat protein